MPGINEDSPCAASLAEYDVATVCHREDRYGMLIEVHAMDCGSIGSIKQPAYARVYALRGNDKEYLGMFAITKRTPTSIRCVVNCDEHKIIPNFYKNKIVGWAKNRNIDPDIKNWILLRFIWDALHP